MSMDHTLRRDPRRPYVITSDGIRRIVLGASAAEATEAAVASSRHSAHASAKPLRTAEAPQDYTLVIAFSERGVLDEHPRQAVAAASLLASAQTAVVVVVLGELHEDLAPCGADIVVVLPDCDSRQFRPEHVLSRLSDPLKQYPPAHVLIPDRLNGEGDLGRRLAAAYKASVATHVVEISPDHVAAYQLVQDTAGRPSRRLARRPLPDVILLEPNVVDTRLPYVGAGQRIDDASRTAAPSVYRDGGLRALEASDLPLEEADLITSAGNGVTDVVLFQRLAKALGAATGASRVAVDDGRFPRDKQIGATGKTVSANAYIAIGISGAVQHLQGIKDCRHVIAINRDIAAPITQRADLSIIGDAQGIMQALLEAVEAARTKDAAEQSPTQERAA
jgi:N,N-dimethylglycine/sarcosine catabolism electron transfer flavoprotein subunit alpha